MPLGSYFSKALFEGLIFGGAYIRRGLSTEENLRFKIDWASLIVGSTGLQGVYIWRGDSTEGFLCYRFGGLIFGGAYTRRGLFSEFYGMYEGAPIYNNIIDFIFFSIIVSQQTFLICIGVVK